MPAIRLPLSPFRRGLALLGRRSLPKTDGQLTLAGLESPVEVLRDRWGVPHIYAHGRHDLLLAQGYVHAQDRLWQMEFQRRLVAGRLAEVLGKAAVDVDRWMRILGMRRVAEQSVALLSAEVRLECEAYCAGVNARIRQKPLPVEFRLLRHTPEPWTTADTLSWIRMMAWALSANWESELMRAQLLRSAGPALTDELETPFLDLPCILTGGVALGRAELARPFTGPPERAGLGSNNWVIAGSRTATGKPLLANDMHLAMTIPAVWYENHLNDGACNIAGVTFPGIPNVVAGHNDHVAWGFTNGFPDVQDLYIEHLRRTPAGEVEYEFRSEWVKAEVRREVIRVRGRRPVEQEVVVTRHGPVINALSDEMKGEEPLALRWTGLEPDNMLEGMRGINCARNCLELREALRYWAVPVQNVVYADVEGNIGYSHPGKVPIRARGDGRVPAPGWTGEYEWTGYIPYDELPHLYNPPSGYIATANNRVAGDDYPYFLSGEYCVSDRAQRIVEMIEACPGPMDVDYVRRMQFDVLSPSAWAVGRVLGSLGSAEPDLAPVVRLMQEWDGRLEANSAAAAVYEAFVRHALSALLTDRLGPLTLRYMGKGPVPLLAEASFYGQRALEWLQHVLADPEARWFAPQGIGGEAGSGTSAVDARPGRDEVLRGVLRSTVADLTTRLGPEQSRWRWGRLHTLTLRHLLGRGRALGSYFNRGPYPLGGDATTVFATGASYHSLESENVVAPPFRFIADLSDLGNCLGLLAPGQSGQPGSRHYDDQMAGWFSGGYHPMLTDRSAVEKVIEAKLQLLPS